MAVEQIKAVQLQVIQRCLVEVELPLRVEPKLLHARQMVRSTQVEPHVAVVLKAAVAAALVTTVAAAERGPDRPERRRAAATWF